MQKEEIYLAGLISVDYPESLAWRLRVAKPLEEMGFKVMSPLRGKGNLKENTRDGGITTTCASNPSILLRDFGDVMRARLILMHLELFGSPRPLTGTVAEAAWAWEHRIPIVGVAFRGNQFVRQHPFWSEFVSIYTETEEEALAFIKRYYAPNNS